MQELGVTSNKVDPLFDRLIIACSERESRYLILNVLLFARKAHILNVVVANRYLDVTIALGAHIPKIIFYSGFLEAV